MTGSSLALNCDTVHDGLIRRSADSWGGPFLELDGTVTMRGMSGALVSLLSIVVLSQAWKRSGEVSYSCGRGNSPRRRVSVAEGHGWGILEG